MDVDFLGSWKESVDKSSSNVALHRTPVEFDGKDHDGAYGRPLGNWGPCFKEIDAFNLLVVAGTKTSLELLNRSIGVSFDTKIQSGQ